MASPDKTPQKRGLESPGGGMQIFTPTDDAPLPFVTRGIALAAASPIHAVDQDGNEITIPIDFLAAGIIHPLRLRKIFATGTTATSIFITD